MARVHRPHAMECPDGHRGERVLQKSLALGAAEDERFRRRPLGGGRWRDKVRGYGSECDCWAHR